MNLSIIATLLLLVPTSAYPWTLVTHFDKVTDEKILVIFEDSIGPVWARSKASLNVIVRCKEKRTNLNLNHPWLVESGEVTVRFDKEEAFQIRGHASDDSKSLLLGKVTEDYSVEAEEDFLEKMETHKKVLFRYDDLSNSSVDAEFKLGNFKKLYLKAKKCL